MRPGWYWIFFQAVPDDLDQVVEAGGGEVREHAALEHRPDPPPGSLTLGYRQSLMVM